MRIFLLFYAAVVNVIQFLSILLFLVLKVSAVSPHLNVRRHIFASPASQPYSLFLQFSHHDLYVSTCVSVTWVVPYARYTYVYYPIWTWLSWFKGSHSFALPFKTSLSHSTILPTPIHLKIYFDIAVKVCSACWTKKNFVLFQQNILFPS